MGMSLPWAEFVSTMSNWTLVGALLIGVLATYGIVVSGNVKETAMKLELSTQRERAAVLEKQAADARLEQERLRERLAWRELKPDTAKALELLLAAHPGSVNVKWVAGDEEAHNLAIHFVNVFAAAKWKVGVLAETNTTTAIFGVWVPDPPEADTPFIRGRLSDVGINFSDAALHSSGTGIGGLVPNGAILFIGSKPPPIL